MRVRKNLINFFKASASFDINSCRIETCIKLISTETHWSWGQHCHSEGNRKVGVTGWQEQHEFQQGQKQSPASRKWEPLLAWGLMGSYEEKVLGPQGEMISVWATGAPWQQRWPAVSWAVLMKAQPREVIVVPLLRIY